MDIAALKKFVSEQTGGVLIRLVNGHEYKIRHRDFIVFNPNADEAARRATSSFIVWEPDGPVLINALIVAQVKPLDGDAPGLVNGSDHQR